jgi:formate/nitrite transporter FocA (FNT family)
MLAGCANVVHPGFPGQEFSSVEQCQRYAFQNKQDQFQCEKVMNAQATGDVVATGILAGFLIFLAVLLGVSASHGGR